MLVVAGGGVAGAGAGAGVGGGGGAAAAGKTIHAKISPRLSQYVSTSMPIAPHIHTIMCEHPCQYLPQPIPTCANLYANISPNPYN